MKQIENVVLVTIKPAEIIAVLESYVESKEDVKKNVNMKKKKKIYLSLDS